MYEKLMKKIMNKRKNYTIPEVELLADSLLIQHSPDKITAPVPVIQIATELGFAAGRISDLKENVVGEIYIGGTTKNIFPKDKVVLVGENEEYYSQRAIIAKELGYYFLEYVANPLYKDSKKLFSRSICSEQIIGGDPLIDHFVFELLMPAHLFLQQYMRIMDYSGHDIHYTIAYLSCYFEVKKDIVWGRLGDVMI